MRILQTSQVSTQPRGRNRFPSTLELGVETRDWDLGVGGRVEAAALVNISTL
jgi:hypothetical protein